VPGGTYSTIETERGRSVLLVRLNLPDRLHAYNLDMLDDLLRRRTPSRYGGCSTGWPKPPGPTRSTCPPPWSRGRLLPELVAGRDPAADPLGPP